MLTICKKKKHVKNINFVLKKTIFTH